MYNTPIILKNIIYKLKNTRKTKRKNLVKRQQKMIQQLHEDLHNQKIRNADLIKELYRQEDVVNALTKQINRE